MDNKIPYKIYLSEDEIPTQWYNVRADMKNKPAPLLNPATLQPLTAADLAPIFCDELNKQELDNDTAYFDIPQEIQNFYRMYRPSPLVRASPAPMHSIIFIPSLSHSSTVSSKRFTALGLIGPSHAS